MDGFASSAMFNLVAAELSRQGHSTAPRSQFSGKIERQSKSEALHQATRLLGPAGTLAIGQGIRGPAFDPVVRILRRATSPEDMFVRWHRLEKYFHSHHRTRVLKQTPEMAELEHHALSGPRPSAGEDLLIAGVLAALLQHAGVVGLSLTVGGRCAICHEQINPHLEVADDTSRWRFRWSGFRPGAQQQLVNDKASSMVDRVTALVLDDPGRSWRLSAIANELAVSTRSLQRQLASENTHFQNLLRAARTEAAAALMNEQTNEVDFQLAAIGYATGFSDQAHFSREFKLRFNMSPTDYRAMALEKPRP